MVRSWVATFFSLHFSDIPLVSNKLKPVLFAGDAVFVHSASHFSDLIRVFNCELKNLYQWLLRNRLTINVEKTVLMVFTNRRHDVNLNSRLKLSDNYVNLSSKTRYFVVVVNHKLSFKNHMKGVSAKISKITQIVNAPKRLSFALMEDLKAKLDELVDQGYLLPVTEPTDWVSSLVVVRKPTGKLRICIDPSNLNKVIKRHHYPTP